MGRQNRSGRIRRLGVRCSGSGQAIGIGITRKEANSIIKKLMEKYLSGIKDPPKGRDLYQCYDIETMKPDDELLKLYDEVVKELNGYGINFK